MTKDIQKVLNDMEARIISAVKQELNSTSRDENKYQNKLHNTRLLLKNYRKFKKHTDQSEFTTQNLIDSELLEMLSSGDNDDIYINSILRTKERTAKMLNYITKVLEFNVSYTQGRRSEHNRALTLKMAYIDGLSQSKIAEKLQVDDRTVRRYIEEGIPDIAPLMFGIDGVKLS